MMTENQTFLRKQAWDYFTIHAAQRITTFNFYIVIASLITTTYFSSFKADSNLQTAKPALACLLLLFSFIFWKLDRRNRMLIKNAEAALMVFEMSENTADPRTKLFTLEADHARSSGSAKSRVLTFWRWNLSYSDCFNLVFGTFACIGLVDVGRALIQLVYHHCH